MTIPIFLVPPTVLVGVLELINASEQISLSLCSKRIREVVKTSRRPKSILLTVVSDAQSRAAIHYSGILQYINVLAALDIKICPESMKKDLEIVKIRNYKVQGIHINGNFVTFWEDPVLGLKTVTDYVSDVFNLDVSSFSFCKDTLWMLEWVKNRQKEPVKKISVQHSIDDTISNEDFDFGLRNSRPTQSLSIYAKPPDNYNFPGIFPKIDEIYINRGPWLTLGGLLTMDSEEIIVGESKFSSSDINIYLRFWIAGGNPRLRFLNFEVPSVDVTKIFGHGLKWVLNEEKRFYNRSPYRTEYMCQGGVQIQRDDGVKATINYTTVSFYMVVWLDDVVED